MFVINPAQCHTMTTRMIPKEREHALLECALKLAASEGLYRMTRGRLASRAGVSTGLVSLYLGTMPQLRQKVLREAIKREILPIIADGLAAHDKAALRAPPVVKRKALEGLVS